MSRTRVKHKHKIPLLQMLVLESNIKSNSKASQGESGELTSWIFFTKRSIKQSKCHQVISPDTTSHNYEIY